MSLANQPAFPSTLLVKPLGGGVFTQEHVSEGGMTIRQHFAGLALQGVLANSGGFPLRDSDHIEWLKWSTTMAIDAADRLIVKLEKP